MIGTQNTTAMSKLLLISNSCMHGRSFLEHVMSALDEFSGQRGWCTLFPSLLPITILTLPRCRRR